MEPFYVTESPQNNSALVLAADCCFFFMDFILFFYLRFGPNIHLSERRHF